MDDFRNFDQLRTPELSIIRHGFFRPWLELTDGQFCYGRLGYIGSWKRMALIETLQGSWTIKRKGLLTSTLLIQQSDEYTIGELTPQIWSRETNLVMTDGFTAVLISKGFFTRTFLWTTEAYGDFLQIKPALWAWKMPFSITVDQNLVKRIPALPLLALLGVNLILMKQAQAAAAGAH